MLATLIKYLTGNKLDSSFLQQLLYPDETTLGRQLLIDVREILACDRHETPRGQNYHRFWRLDAGIPMAYHMMTCNRPDLSLRVHGFAYLIFQIRENLQEYDVSLKLLNYINDATCVDAWHRCMLLYLALEYLIQNQGRPSNRGYFKRIDYSSGIVKKLVDLAWLHFTEDKRYPLIGLEVLFALGVCYGLPLLKEDRQFHLLFPNITLHKLSSPELNSQQLRRASDYLRELQGLVEQKYHLSRLLDCSKREGLTTASCELNAIQGQTYFSASTTTKRSRSGTICSETPVQHLQLSNGR